MSNPFDSDYYLQGINTGKSNYENYRWLPKVTRLMVKYLQNILGFKKDDTFLDFGCARGYTVRALREIGIKAYGYDISTWAIENCDKSVKNYVSNTLNDSKYDYIFAKDVFEHIPEDELTKIIHDLLSKTNKTLFIIVPITKETNGKYVCPRDELDSTHVIRWNLKDWMDFLHKITFEMNKDEFIIFASYKIPGIKPMCYQFPGSYAFIKIDKYAKR
jgi:Methyltransferase domain